MNGSKSCPQCQAAVAADAPEGLCPACLLAGGLASGQAPPPASAAAYAVTTPPSQPTLPPFDVADLANRFPQLEILELLGQGGMGAVYKVRQRNLDRMAALKIIPPAAAKDPTFAERFSREAKSLARLGHPNIVTVYDFGQVDGVYFLLMEYVDGLNLRQTLRAAKLQPREALAIVPQICEALQFAHDQGIVHRDIKPENILLDRAGRVKIADFGLAKLLDQSRHELTLTQTMQVMGTPRYMAPEQIERPQEVDHRADIYSLGVVLYEMLTGELPLGRFAPPSQKVEVDVRIDEIVLRALEKEPEKRFQKVSEVKTELDTVASTPRHGRKGLEAEEPALPPVEEAAELTFARALQFWKPQPGYAYRVALPWLFMLAVFAALLIDLSLATNWEPTLRMPLTIGLAVAGAISLAGMFLALTAWQINARRFARQTGEPATAWRCPAGSSLWLAALALLGFASMPLPWARLSMNDVNARPVAEADGSPSIRELAEMPTGSRYGSEVGFGQKEGAGVFAISVAALGVVGLTALLRFLRPLRPALFTLGGIVLLGLAFYFVHRVGDRVDDLVIDRTTTVSIEQNVRYFPEFQNASYDTSKKMINELRAKVAKEIHVWPALGWYLVVTVGLLFAFSGITEWCWNIGRASDPAVALAAAREKSRALAASKKVALELNAADIERIRQQVQWPALGLVATGILGFAPLLIGVLLIPIFLFSLPHGSNAANRARPPLADGLRTPNVVVASLASPAHLSFPLAISRPILGRVSLPIGALPGGVGPWELAIIGPGCLGIPISILLILGGLRMMRLQSYPLAQCAAIAALLPCGIGWLLGLPMGIWALTLLNQPDVKAAFEACRTR